jgi:hypothetical protein
MTECRIENVIYNKHIDIYASDSHLTVRVRWAEMNEKAYPGIRQLAVSFIQPVYQLYTLKLNAMDRYQL